MAETAAGLIAEWVVGRLPQLVQKEVALLPRPEAGPAAKDGRDGRDGADGQDGVGIERIEQPDSETARVVLSDGREYDLALPRGRDGRDGLSQTVVKAGSTKVAAAAPAAPVVVSGERRYAEYALSGKAQVIALPDGVMDAGVVVVDADGAEVSVVVRHQSGRVTFEANLDMTGLTARLSF